MPKLLYRHHQGSGPVDLNRSAIWEDTTGVRPSQPIHVGAYSRTEERERLQTSYNNFHNYKLTMHDRRKDISSKASSYRLLAGTNEFAEDLTGQRMPLNASQWKSETKAKFYATQLRPSSAPIRRIISLMDSQEPVFAKTDQLSDPQIKDVYPHKPICPSRFNQRDAYETSYNESHRPFSQHERRAAAHWENKDQRERQWLRDPITSKKLQMRVPIPPSSVTKIDDSSLSHKYFNVNKLDPSEAQISTLPHYTDPYLNLGKSEKQMSYSNPYRAQDFYFEEPNTVKKPIVQHLERSFIN